MSDLPHEGVHFALGALRHLLEVEQIYVATLIVPQLHLVDGLEDRLDLFYLFGHYPLVIQQKLI
jgi:hypothetical protein